MSFVKTAVVALWDLGRVVRYHASINPGSQRHLLLTKWLTVNQVVSVVSYSNKCFRSDNRSPGPMRLQSSGEATRLKPRCSRNFCWPGANENEFTNQILSVVCLSNK
jgi:hypothetical protein